MDIDDALAQIRTATSRLGEAQAAVDDAKLVLQREALRALMDSEGDDDRRQRLVHRLYWEMPDLPVRTMEAVLGSGAAVRRLAGPGPVVSRCAGCGEDLRAASRSQLTNRPRSCAPCDTAQRAEEQRRLEDEWAAERAWARHAGDWADWDDEAPDGWDVEQVQPPRGSPRVPW